MFRYDTFLGDEEGVPVPTDPYWADVKLLLYGEGADGNTTFTDHSPIGRTLTPAGNVQHDTGIDVEGQSILFDGSGDYITTPITSGLSVADSVDVTFECFVKFSAFDTGQNQTIIDTRRTGTASRGYTLIASPDGATLFWVAWNTNTITAVNFNGSASFSTGVTYHIAVTREGATWRLFVDGVKIAEANETATPADASSGAVFNIGRTGDTSFNRYLKGSLNWLRVTKGVARYTGGFTVPETPFPQV